MRDGSFFSPPSERDKKNIKRKREGTERNVIECKCGSERREAKINGIHCKEEKKKKGNN